MPYPSFLELHMRARVLAHRHTNTYFTFFDTAIFSVFLNDVILHFTAKVCLCILTGENVLTRPPTRPLAIAYYTIEPSKNDGAF